MFHGGFPNGILDHINGNKSDNRIENLRESDHQKNSQNQRKATKRNLTGFLGVSVDRSCIPRPYVARIKAGGKNIRLGQFQTPEQAHEAYVKAKRELHAGCTI